MMKTKFSRRPKANIFLPGRRGAVALAALCVLLGACSPLAQRPPAPSPSPSSAALASPSPSPPKSPSPSLRGTVFVIVMENRSYAGAMQGSYTAKLAGEFAVAENYHAVAHPSLPNYLALTGGSTYGITDDSYHRLDAQGLGGELNSAGVAWKAYMEGMTRGCFDSPYPYALKHNPFAYYQGGCPANVVSASALAADLARPDPPRLAWITPGLCHDGHDCTTAVADAYLAQLVPEILASAAWKDNGLLLITWDEAEGDPSNRVPCIVVAPSLLASSSQRYYDHYSLLATLSRWLGVPPLGQAASATPFTDLLPGL